MLQNLGIEDKSFSSAVTLGCHQAIGSYFLPNFYSSLEISFPNYKVELKHDLSRNIQQEIQAGRIDIGVVVNPINNPDLIIKKIAEDKVCVWKSKKKKIQNQIIADLNLMQSQSIIKKWTKRPHKTLPIESLDLIARLTEAGCGYGIIPERTVKLLKLQLVAVSKTPSYKDIFSIVYRPEFGKSQGLRI